MENKQTKGRTVRNSLKWMAPAMLLVTLTVGSSGFVGNAHAETTSVTPAQTQTHTISVTGNGEVAVAPDIAYVTLGIQTKASTAKEAQKTNADKFEGLKKVLATYKVPAEDVQTVAFYVNPEYNYNDKSGPKLTGYTAIHSIQIAYRDLNQLGNLVDAASAAGANHVDGVRFDTEKTELYETAALERAMSNAEQKAKTIAKAAKQQIVTIINVAQSSANVYPVIQNQVFAKSEAAAADSSTSFQGGQIKIKTNVNVTYEIK